MSHKLNSAVAEIGVEIGKDSTSRELCSARFLLSRCPLWVIRRHADPRD